MRHLNGDLVKATYALGHEVHTVYDAAGQRVASFVTPYIESVHP